MSKSKAINIVCYVALALMLVIAVTVWIVKAAEERRSTLTVGYESLFDKSSSGKSYPGSSSSSQQSGQAPYQTTGQQPNQMPAQTTGQQTGQAFQMAAGQQSQPASGQSSGSEGQRTMPSGMDFGRDFSRPQGFGASRSSGSGWTVILIYALMLLVAIGLVILVRRRNE